MQITIDGEIFVRFARLARSVAPNDARTYLRSVFVESGAAGTFAIATNSRFAAVQKISNDDFGFAKGVTVEDYFFQQVEQESQFGGTVIVENERVLTSFGFIYPGNPFIEPTQGQKNEFHDWRNWFEGGLSNFSQGNVFFDIEQLTTLATCSPSGSLVLPNFIDVSKPLIVKDPIEENWLGVFIARPEKNMNFDFGKLPEWVNND